MKYLASLRQSQKVALGVALVICIGVVLPFVWFLQREPREFKQPTPIAFAGGSFQQKQQVSSLQSLKENQGRGFSTFQLTMGWNKDGKLACKREVPTEMQQYFGVASVYGGEGMEPGPTSFNQPCTAEELASWLRDNAGTQVIIDMQDDTLKGLTALKDMLPTYNKQVIVQISDPALYQDIKNLGYQRFVYLVRDFRLNQEEIISQLGANRYVAVALPMQLVDRQMIRRLKRRNTQTYAYVIDNCEMVSSLSVTGVDGIYTNLIAPGVCDQRTIQFRSASARKFGQ